MLREQPFLAWLSLWQDWQYLLAGPVQKSAVTIVHKWFANLIVVVLRLFLGFCPLALSSTALE